MGDPLSSATFIGTGIFVLFIGFGTLRHQRRITGTPTSTARSAAVGLVEIKGKAIGTPEFTTPISKTPVLYHRYQEFELRVVRRGRNHSRQWVLVGDTSEGRSIAVDDGTGSVQARVDAIGHPPDIQACRIYVRRTGRDFKDRIFGRKHDDAPIEEVSERDTVGWGGRPRGKIGDRKFVETAIVPGTELYILGAKDLEGVIGADAEHEYVLTDKTEKQVAEEKSNKAKTLIIIGTSSIVIGCISFFA